MLDSNGFCVPTKGIALFHNQLNLKRLWRSLLSLRLLLFLLIAAGIPHSSIAQEPSLVLDLYPGNSTSPQPPSDLIAVENTLYFVAYGTDLGIELWKSDGTAVGTVVVKDLRPGPGNSDPKIIGAVNGLVIFEAWDGGSARGLWRSDGTESGTFKIKDLTTNWTKDKRDTYTEAIGSTLFFVATDSTNGPEIWESDGTATGTVLVKDIYPGPYTYYSPYNLTNVNNVLYFTGYDGLWKSDGTASGTTKVKNFSYSLPQYLTNVNGTLFFRASYDGTSGNELWKSDGTDAGTVQVCDIYPGSNGSDPQYLTNVNGTLFFTASDGTNGRELWKSDGTVIGTTLVKDAYPGSNSSSPSQLTNFNGLLFFVADNGTNGRELWKSNGFSAGTALLMDINKATYFSSSPSYLLVVNGILYFIAHDGINGTEFWKSDGTALGTTMVKNIYAGNTSSSPQNLTNVNGNLFFTATDNTNGRELWVLNTKGKAPVIGSISDATISDDRVYTGPTPMLTGGTAPITWSLVQKPAGMTINATTGVVSWPTPTTTGSPFTVTIKATNTFGQASVSWKLTVYHPGPPSTPLGGLVIAYKIRTPSVSPDGQTVQYTYVWTSDKGDRVTHGPTTATMDVLDEMQLVSTGETWTVRATPSVGGRAGTAAVATVKFIDLRTGSVTWAFYK
jgi:ELWxxDGT repeat protein